MLLYKLQSASTKQLKSNGVKENNKTRVALSGSDQNSAGTCRQYRTETTESQ